MNKLSNCGLLIVLIMICIMGCQQLPDRQGINLNAIPSLETGTIIPSANGLLSEGIGKVPGSICVVDSSTGKCDLNGLAPSQCILQGSEVEVKPIAHPTPAYHSLIDNQYSSSISVPFINPSNSSQVVEEIKASISGTASIKSVGGDRGYPGIDGIKACLLRMYGPGNYGTVYWISSANIISVTRTGFTKVSNSMDVTGTGFGANGKTYNSNGTSQDSVWVGILPHKINVGQVSAPIVARSQASVVSSENMTTVIDTTTEPPAPPAPTTAESVTTELQQP